VAGAWRWPLPSSLDLRMNGTIPPSPHMPSRCAVGQRHVVNAIDGSHSNDGSIALLERLTSSRVRVGKHSSDTFPLRNGLK
jgi:hypothetical protein